jgi:hypothetical protein
MTEGVIISNITKTPLANSESRAKPVQGSHERLVDELEIVVNMTLFCEALLLDASFWASLSAKTTLG